MTPEILIVGDPAGRRPLADAIAASGYGVSLCSPRELNRRVRTSSPPTVIVACIGDVDPDVLLAGLRRTRAGASIPVILYGRLSGTLRDLADVLDIGADHFIEEPAAEGEFEDALMQYAGPPRSPLGRELGVARDDEERSHPGARGGPPGEELGRDPDDLARGGHFGTERLEERERPRPERGKALGELHRTLDRLEAQLRADDHRSDPELAALGLDGIPDVDPPDEVLSEDDPLITDLDHHLRGPASERYAPVRGDELTQPSEAPLARDSGRGGYLGRDSGRDSVRDVGREFGRDPGRDFGRGPGRDSSRDSGREASRKFEQERSRPRTPRRDPTARLGRTDPLGGPNPAPHRSVDPDHDTGPVRRSWGDEPSDEDGRSDLTRPWVRPESEGPLRRDRESASSMLGGRPARARHDQGASGAVEEPGELDGDRPGAARPRPRGVLRPKRPDRDAAELESSRAPGRYDPHAGNTPWPVDDFDPSESTMIRRERGDATTRRRSLGSPSESPTRGRPPTHVRPRPPEPRRGREPEPWHEPRPEPRPEPELRPEPEPPIDRPIPTRRSPRRPEPSRAASTLHIDPSLRESGQLSLDVDVATVLWALHDQRFTGKLRLTRQRIEKQIWLHDGEGVFARSTATSDRLVDGLLRRGVLTRPQYETARRLAAKEPRRAGELLVDAGFLKSRELDVLLRDHLARVIDSTFVWTEGAWTTEPGERTDEPIQLEVPMAALILDGVRYRCDASELEDRLTRRIGGRGPLVPRLRTGAELGDDRAAALAAMIDELGETFRLLPEEESWLRRFDGRHGVAALLADGADEQALFALLFTLDLGGYVELREQPGPLALSDRDPAQLDGERILERLRLAREADYFELLGLGRDAARSEIRQAHTELSATFADDALEDDSRRRHARELRELREALEEARDILADDAMRSAYLAHLGG